MKKICNPLDDGWFVNNDGITSKVISIDASNYNFTIEGSLVENNNEFKTNSLLSWSNLMNPSIIGQPVWSIEKRKWFLIMDSALDNRSWVDLVDACGKTYRIIEHDLKKYKLSKNEIID